jgi:hypothetical protein
MLFRLKRAYEYKRAHRDFARVLATPPVTPEDKSAIILSQVQHRDVLMYLVAAKSFAYHNRVGCFHVIDDGSLTARDYSLLREHLPGITITHLSVHHANSAVKGGTWERLTALVALSRTAYVVQLDSDTVTLGPLPEVRDCIRENRSFAMTVGHGRQQSQILPLNEVSERARLVSSDHIQITAERRLAELDPSIGTHYAIATSAFAGFAPSCDRAERLDRFSRAMASLLQERWAEWGSEQISSNFLIACDPQAILLPHNRYQHFHGYSPASDCKFLHFFGTHRFEAGVYRLLARETARLLCQS